ncbi:hypothetical protein KSS87_014159 [Heliosperma pusillum]|nr:hypothetical protein KSS87_014159 [Heliosperma pusillum]
MELQVFLVFVALLSVSISVSVYGIESMGEAYWKMNLGSDTNMPRVVKDALLDTGNQANKEYANGAQAFAQQLSEARTNTVSFGTYAKGAQSYAQKLSGIGPDIVLSFGTYAKGAQSYAQQLAAIGVTIGSFGTYAKGAQAANKNNGKVAQKYNSKGSELLTDDSVIFFTEKDLIYPGSSMKLHFLMGAQGAKFMPSYATNSMPFSSSKLQVILKFFAVKPESKNAKIIEQTITTCETQAIKGEEKSCETSLEGMVNYAKSKLGNQIKTISTEVNKETKQEYQIKSATKINNQKNLVCHKMVYPYAVFYCHTLSKTDTYKVSLVDSTGKKIRAVAICHKDTSQWNPEHLAFQLLKVKPGSVPICHFLSVDAMVWVPK